MEEDGCFGKKKNSSIIIAPSSQTRGKGDDGDVRANYMVVIIALTLILTPTPTGLERDSSIVYLILQLTDYYISNHSRFTIFLGRIASRPGESALPAPPRLSIRPVD